MLEEVKKLIEDSIQEMNDYIDDENNGYDDLERHDCSVACDAYEFILKYVEELIRKNNENN